MSLTRHEVREAEFLTLFEKQFRSESVDEILQINRENDDFDFTPEVHDTVEEILDKLPEIDEIISKFSTKRTIDRIPKINLAILRLAVFELNYRADKVPERVAVNEAVGLAKAYSQESDVTFVNGLLGAYTRSRKSEQDG